MSYCVNQIVQLATDIYQDIGSPSSLSVGFISGWLIDSGNLGSINNKLSTSFYLTGDAPCITDDGGNFGGEEADIYTLMFKTYFYEGQSLSVLAGGGSFWTSLSEGDTKFSRSDITKISQAYLNLQQSARQDLRLAIADYKLRISVPQSVDAASIYSFPP
jgi:hypothetical protein